MNLETILASGEVAERLVNTVRRGQGIISGVMGFHSTQFQMPCCHIKFPSNTIKCLKSHKKCCNSVKFSLNQYGGGVQILSAAFFPWGQIPSKGCAQTVQCAQSPHPAVNKPGAAKTTIFTNHVHGAPAVCVTVQKNTSILP